MNLFVTWLKSPHIADYWYAQDLIAATPPLDWKLMPFYLGFTVLCFLLAFSLPFIRQLHPSIKERLSIFAWTNVMLGIILGFLRYQRIPLLGMDLWRSFQEIGNLIWLFYFIRYLRRDYPKILLAEKVIQHKKRYLPKTS